jgi:hypothetical protein
MQGNQSRGTHKIRTTRVSAEQVLTLLNFPRAIIAPAHPLSRGVQLNAPAFIFHIQIRKHAQARRCENDDDDELQMNVNPRVARSLSSTKHALAHTERFWDAQPLSSAHHHMMQAPPNAAATAVFLHEQL